MPLDTPSSVLLKPLTFVTAVHEIRPLNTAYVKRLQQKICAIGVKPYPLSVTPAGVLFGGRHRYEAFKAEGITECLMHISEPASLDREAIELNRASEDALPMSFVDYAEMVWRKVAGGATQQVIAEELGWSRSAVAHYVALQAITAEAWAVVVPTFGIGLATPADDEGTLIVPTGTIFSERLLRDILTLTADQQLELVQDLAAGGATNGPVIGTTFESEAVAADVSTVPFPEGPLYPLPPCVGPSPSSALLTQASCPQPSPYEIGGWFSQRRENHRHISRPVRSPDQHRHVPRITMRSTRW